MPHIAGVGLGLRSAHIETILAHSPAIPWFELLTDNWLDASGIDGYLLDSILERYPVVLHGVAMNLGGVQPLNLDYLTKVRCLAERCQTDWISDHLCFSAADGMQLHDLLPLPRNHETLAHLVARISHAQDVLQRRISIENISAYMHCAQNSYAEADFLNELATRSGCGVLMDINNLYVNQHNLNESADTFIDAIQPKHVTQYHLGGYTDKGDYLLDAHNHAVSAPVWALFQKTLVTVGERPTLIEWDNDLPEFATLLHEKQQAEEMMERAYACTIPV